MIKPETRARIKAYLEVFIENQVERYRHQRFSARDHPAEYLARAADRRGNLKPFQPAILPPEVLRISAFERGFVTSLGTSFEPNTILKSNRPKPIKGSALRLWNVSCEFI